MLKAAYLQSEDWSFAAFLHNKNLSGEFLEQKNLLEIFCSRNAEHFFEQEIAH